MKKKKSPYMDFTEEEIRKAEEGAYLIQLGTEYFDYKGKYSFTFETAEKFFFELQAGLHDMLSDKKKRDRAEVLTTLLNLRITPLRFH